MPRMQILGSVERQEFDSPPVFTSLQRKRYFDFSRGVRALAGQLRGPTNRVLFLVSFGYFKATHRFYLSDQFQRQDIDVVAHSIGLDGSSVDPERYVKQTRNRHRQLIRAYFGFRAFDAKAQVFIRTEIEVMARSQLQPRLIFLRAVDLLVENRIEVPGYPKLARLALAAVNRRRMELSRIIEHVLDDEVRKQLDLLLIRPDVKEDTSHYRLTRLKRLSQSTKPSKIKEQIADLERIRSLYDLVRPALEAMGLSHAGFKYYANTVIKSDIYYVARRGEQDRYLHLIAFIAHQYYRLQDNLVDVLISVVQSSINNARREHKERCYEVRAARAESFREFVSLFDTNLLGVLSTISAITHDHRLVDSEKVVRIQKLLAAHELSVSTLFDGVICTLREGETGWLRRLNTARLPRSSGSLATRSGRNVTQNLEDSTSGIY